MPIIGDDDNRSADNRTTFVHQHAGSERSTLFDYGNVNVISKLQARQIQLMRKNAFKLNS